MSFLLSSPQGTGPQRHLRHDRRYQRSLHRPRKPEQAVSIPGSEVVQNSCVPVWVGSLPSAVFLPLEQVRNQQKIRDMVVLQAPCRSTDGVIKHSCF